MELFRINGLSSEDLMRPGGASPRAFLGSMFKMGGQQAAPPPEALSPDEGGAALPPAKADAQPAAQPTPADGRWTDKTLAGMTKDRLVEIGASLGVVDLAQAKPKLIEAIIAAQ